MSGYHWLLLQTGELVIGNKKEDRSSWSAMWPSGSLGAVTNSQVLDFKPIPEPNAKFESTIVGKIEE